MKTQCKSPKHLHQTSSKFLKQLKQTTFLPKNLHGPLKISPNCKVSPNLVTLKGA
jgi:hypothetical protein